MDISASRLIDSRHSGLSHERKGHTIIINGLGSIGLRLARLSRDHLNQTVFAFRSVGGQPNPLGFPEIHDEHEIARLHADVAFITNPTSMHVGSALAYASRGIHLFVEKPLSNRMDQLDLLMDTVRSNQLLTYVGCNLRFDPMIEHLKNNLPLERVLRARVVSSSYLPDWRPEQDYRKSYSARRSLGGGVILDLIHEPDYCHWLFGKIERIEGEAGKSSPLEIDVEDFADMTIFHATGIQTSVHLDYFSPCRERKIAIYGEDLYVEADLVARTLTKVEEGRGEIMHFSPLDQDSTYIAELKYFFEHLDGRTQPMNNFEEHLAVLRPVLEFKDRLGI
jgi:predicted dehydrogenase